MTEGLIRQALRLWATILVAWAVVLSGMLPSLGADMAMPSGVICSASASDGGSAPDTPMQHGKLCCVVCAAASVSALPAPSDDAVAIPQPTADAAVRAVGRTAESIPRAPPEAWPLNPRAPPSIA